MDTKFFSTVFHGIVKRFKRQTFAREKFILQGLTNTQSSCYYGLVAGFTIHIS